MQDLRDAEAEGHAHVGGGGRRVARNPGVEDKAEVGGRPRHGRGAPPGAPATTVACALNYMTQRTISKDRIMCCKTAGPLFGKNAAAPHLELGR